jgi:hypothetical protein
VILRALPAEGATKEAVVLMWEPTGIDDGRTRLAALEALAAVAARIRGAIYLPLNHITEQTLERIVDVLSRHGVRALPAVDLTGGDEASPSANTLETSLRSLASADAIAQWDGVRYVAVNCDSEAPFGDQLAPLLAALGAPQSPVRVGWVRRRSAHPTLPAGTDFAFDWPPYGTATVAGAAMIDCDYLFLAAEIARRDAGAPIALSVLWSTATSVELPDAATRVSGISALKIAYAVDTVRRFVGNREGQRIPFWVLRAAFDPDVPGQVAALSNLTALLAKPPAQSGSSALVGRIELPARSRARLAVVVHLYYPELWDEFADAIAALPEPCDLFVSCPTRACDAVARMVHARYRDAVVFGIQNLGRDVLPFLLWLRTPGIERYKYVLKFHSKKSEHLTDFAAPASESGDAWRHRALDSLIGEPRSVTALLRTLDAQADVGIVAPAGLLYDQVTLVYANADLLASLCETFAAPGPMTGRFPVGTMFWARVTALAPLARAPAQALNFEREAGQVDGTLHHSYERLFPWIAASQGFRTVDTAELLD